MMNKYIYSILYYLLIQKIYKVKHVTIIKGFDFHFLNNKGIGNQNINVLYS